LKRSLRCV
ncbi:hypothetical protein D046_7480B, partial [Vibrio parahaemolyticus V-223/04]